MGDGLAGGDFFKALAGLKEEYESKVNSALKGKSKPPFLQKNYLFIMWDVFTSFLRPRKGLKKLRFYISHFDSDFFINIHLFWIFDVLSIQIPILLPTFFRHHLCGCAAMGIGLPLDQSETSQRMERPSHLQGGVSSNLSTTRYQRYKKRISLYHQRRALLCYHWYDPPILRR